MERRVELAQWQAWAEEGWSVVPYLVQYKGATRGLPCHGDMHGKPHHHMPLCWRAVGRTPDVSWIAAGVHSAGKGCHGEIIELSDGLRTQVTGEPRTC